MKRINRNKYLLKDTLHVFGTCHIFIVRIKLIELMDQGPQFENRSEIEIEAMSTNTNIDEH
ncbi:hypothetical protein BLOT_013198 [Blomia tropicalis]|nr:hypothetical protein BLOT_013198 [Blomia tropicalis]